MRDEVSVTISENVISLKDKEMNLKELILSAFK